MSPYGTMEAGLEDAFRKLGVSVTEKVTDATSTGLEEAFNNLSTAAPAEDQDDDDDDHHHDHHDHHHNHNQHQPPLATAQAENEEKKEKKDEEEDSLFIKETDRERQRREEAEREFAAEAEARAVVEWAPDWDFIEEVVGTDEADKNKDEPVQEAASDSDDENDMQLALLKTQKQKDALKARRRAVKRNARKPAVKAKAKSRLGARHAGIMKKKPVTKLPRKKVGDASRREPGQPGLEYRDSKETWDDIDNDEDGDSGYFSEYLADLEDHADHEQREDDHLDFVSELVGALQIQDQEELTASIRLDTSAPASQSPFSLASQPSFGGFNATSAAGQNGFNAPEYNPAMGFAGNPFGAALSNSSNASSNAFSAAPQTGNPFSQKSEQPNGNPLAMAQPATNPFAVRSSSPAANGQSPPPSDLRPATSSFQFANHATPQQNASPFMAPLVPVAESKSAFNPFAPAVGNAVPANPAPNPFAPASRESGSRQPSPFGTNNRGSPPSQMSRFAAPSLLSTRQPSPFEAAGTLPPTSNNPFQQDVSDGAVATLQPDGVGQTASTVSQVVEPRGSWGILINKSRTAGHNGLARSGSRAYAKGEPSAENHARRIQEQLRKDKLKPPQWPSEPGNPAKRGAVENFKDAYKKYRERARESLIKAKLIDDPDEKKRLEDAIDFKGVCEEMCPEYEKIRRILENDVKMEEKDTAPDGLSKWAAPHIMVKALARSAAGQEQPLPMDVRSVSCLKRTLDYLINDCLQSDDNLPALHNFLWDRTRAIRRDFVFHSKMSRDEMKDVVYCLETITRFHVTALHLLSRKGFAAEDFSEQQEVEQLRNSLMSLIQAYEDCKKKGLEPVNEAEFRAYWIILFAEVPNIHHTIQQLGQRFWKESDEIQTATTIVELMQDIWRTKGPFRDEAAVTIALNAHSTIFSIVEDPKVSYSMACFVSIHFKTIRRSMLKTIAKAYWRVKSSPLDLTPTFLNKWFRFDSNDELVDFIVQHGLLFEESNGDGEPYLALTSASYKQLSYPTLRQSFSETLIERKRSNATLPELVHEAVYDEASETPIVEPESPNSLFIAETPQEKARRMEAANHPDVWIAAPVFGASSTDFSPVPLPQSVPAGPYPAPTFSKQATTTNGAGTSSTPTFSFLSQKSQRSTTTAGAKPAIGTTLAQGSTEPTEPTKQVSSLPGASGSSPSSQPSLFGPPQPIGTSFLPALPQPGHVIKATETPALTPTPPTLQTSQTRTTAEMGNTAGSIELTPAEAAASNRRSSSTPSTSATPQAVPVSSGSDVGAAPLSGRSTTAPTLFTNSNAASSKTKSSPLPRLAAAATTKALLASDSITNLSHPNPSLEEAVMSSSGAKPTVQQSQPKPDLMAGFTNWVVNGDNGLMDQFTSALLEQIVRGTFEQYQHDEEERRRQEEEDEAEEKVHNFKIYNLRVKYFYRWRRNAWELRRGKMGEEYRRRQREYYAEKRKEEKATRLKVEREAKRKAEGSTAEEDLLATGIFNCIRNKREAARRATRGFDSRTESSFASDDEVSIQAAPTPDTQSNTPSYSPPQKKESAKMRALKEEFGIGGTKRSARPSSANGISNFSRSLPSNFGRRSLASSTASVEKKTKRVSNVKSEYWRLKARGLVIMPDGRALHESLAIPMLYEGKRYPGLGNFGLPPVDSQSQTPEPEANSPTSSSLSRPITHGRGMMSLSQSLHRRSMLRETRATTSAEYSPPSKRKRTSEDAEDGAVADLTNGMSPPGTKKLATVSRQRRRTVAGQPANNSTTPTASPPSKRKRSLEDDRDGKAGRGRMSSPGAVEKQQAQDTLVEDAKRTAEELRRVRRELEEAERWYRVQNEAMRRKLSP